MVFFDLILLVLFYVWKLSLRVLIQKLLVMFCSCTCTITYGAVLRGDHVLVVATSLFAALLLGFLQPYVCSLVKLVVCSWL